MRKIIEMFLSFFKIGAFTFGGGYAMIPLIEDEVVNKKQWLSKEEFLDILVVSQSLPGAISINCSIFIGKKIGGILGCVLAILGVALPSFLIIIFITKIFVGIRDNQYINAAFNGINASIPLLILSGVISISRGVQKNKRNIIIFLLALGLIYLNINPIFVIMIFAIYGGIYLKNRG